MSAMGHLATPDTQPDPARSCQACGKPLVRRHSPSGRLEQPGVFARRRYCNRACAGKAVSHANPTPWRNGSTVVPTTTRGDPPRTLAPRDPAAPEADIDDKNPNEFLKALKKATEKSLRDDPSRWRFGSSQRRNEELVQ
jgi:hypothetical protein